MDMACAGKEETEAIVSDGIGHCIGDISNDYAVLGCCLEVDAIGTNSATSDEFEIGEF